MKKQLKTIERGQTFAFAGHEWITLEHDEAEGTTLVLMANILENRAFDEDNNADWRQSSARKYLNGPVYDNLTEAAGLYAGAISMATVDLTADDGTFRETSQDRVFLLSAEQYRRNRDIIEPIDDWWWTITRYSASNSYFVRYVYTDGTLGYNDACDGDGGLRPALLLSSDLLISDTDDMLIDSVRELSEKWEAAGISPETAVKAIKAATAILFPGEEADDE